MNSKELASLNLEKAYDPKSFEDRIYALWKENGAFALETSGDSSQPPFVVVIPPPNVTVSCTLGTG